MHTGPTLACSTHNKSSARSVSQETQSQGCHVTGTTSIAPGTLVTCVGWVRNRNTGHVLSKALAKYLHVTALACCAINARNLHSTSATTTFSTAKLGALYASRTGKRQVTNRVSLHTRSSVLVPAAALFERRHFILLCTRQTQCMMQHITLKGVLHRRYSFREVVGSTQLGTSNFTPFIASEIGMMLAVLTIIGVGYNFSSVPSRKPQSPAPEQHRWGKVLKRDSSCPWYVPPLAQVKLGNIGEGLLSAKIAFTFLTGDASPQSAKSSLKTMT